MKSSQTPSPATNQITEANSRFDEWYNQLRLYHTGRFARNYLDWTGYVDDKSTTKSKLADPMPFELIERLVNRMFNRNPKVSVCGVGLNLRPEIADSLKARAESAWSNPNMTMNSGSMRQKIMMSVREYGIT